MLDLSIIKKFEGLKLSAYICPAGVPTIGYGNTRYPDGSKVKIGDRITLQQAEEYLRIDAERRMIAMALPVGLNWNQRSALVSFAFNVGVGAWNRSTLRKKVLADKKDPTIRNEFMKWNRGGGQVLNGLTKRRKAEADLYFTL